MFFKRLLGSWRNLKRWVVNYEDEAERRLFATRLQIEQEQTTQHLLAALQQKDVLDRLDPSILSLIAGPGSLVTTASGKFYMSTGMGKLTIDNETVISISSQSPLGIKMKGCKMGDTVDMNGMKYLIIKID